MVHNRPIEDRLTVLKRELNDELNNIFNYWMNNTADEVYGGFVGRIDEQNKVIENSPKGSVLNARILWSFSAAYNLSQNPEYLQYAERGYQYIIDHFIDNEFGGVYWSVDYEGKPLDTKKQVYANAFTIYGLSEYYIASGNENARTLAIELYNSLIKNSFDIKNTCFILTLHCFTILIYAP